MRHAGKILRETFTLLEKYTHEGVSLLELDHITEDFIRSQNAKPSFKGFQGFPATLCTMLNEEVVHGIPNERKLQKGDLLTIDCGVYFQNYHADAAISKVIGGDDTNPERARFSKSVKEALILGCEAARAGNTLGDIGNAIETKIKKDGYTVLSEYTGHGIGRGLHEEPFVLNYGKKGTGLLLREGMTLCIEPIIVSGEPKVKIKKDGWTVVTKDEKDAIQWEHCGVVTKNGLEIFV